MSADICVTSRDRVANALLAVEISNPSTSAESVPSTPIDTVTTLFVSLLRWCSGRAHPTSMPSRAPANTAVSTIRPISIELTDTTQYWCGLSNYSQYLCCVTSCQGRALNSHEMAQSGARLRVFAGR
jgi:hypothetical protein